MKLAEKIKTWPVLALHRFEALEKELIALEERVTALEPKKVEPKKEEAKLYTPPAPPAPSPLMPMNTPKPDPLDELNRGQKYDPVVKPGA
jgi:hypothetical protein